MSSTQKCPQCGTALPAGTPPWLCPTCLLRQAAGPTPAEEPASEEASMGVASSTGLAGDALPRRLGAYELLEVIGRGGMGVVYKARQVSLDRHVAVKVLSLNALVDRETVHRFRTEAVTAGSLQHPNIVAVHEVGLAEGQHYLVMDHVPGGTLADLVRTGPLPAGAAAQCVRTIADAVHFAHERGILHRDLKPSNVLIDENDQPRVTDFGLAKRLADLQPSTLNSQLTLSGQVLGSPAFIPPEQASGQRGRIGRRSDVYALGAILYQLLTGRPPFVGEALADTLRQVLNDEPLGPRLLNPSVPRDLETICLKCLEKEPDRRYPTAQTLAEELGRWLENRPILARPLGPFARAARWCRRKPLVAGLAAALALAIVGGFVGILTQLERSKAAELAARRHAYAADLNRVQQALEGGDLSTAREVLDRHRPAGESDVRTPKSELDLRGWEWRYLWARSRSEERPGGYQYPGAVSALAFSPDGKWLAVRWEEEGLELWDAVAGQPVTRLPARNAKGWHWLSKALAFSPHGNLLAWGNADGSSTPIVSVRDLSTERQIRSLAHTSELVSVAFSPDTRLLAGLADDGVVRVWELESGQVLTNFATHPVRSKTWIERGPGAGEAVSSAPAAGRDQAPERSQQPARPVMRSTWQGEHYGCLQFSPDGRWLAVGEAMPQIRLWDRTTWKEAPPLTMPADAGGINAVAFSPDGTRLAASAGGRSGDVRVWDLASRSEQRFMGHRAWVTGLAFSPDGQTLATGGADQTLRLWDVAGGRELRQFRGNTAEIWSIAWSPDGQDLVTGARDGTVRHWDPASKPTPACAMLPTQAWCFGLAFTPDGRSLLAVNFSTTTVENWDVATLRKEPLLFPGAGYLSLGLSSDGRWLALGDTNGHVRVWDFRSERLATEFVLPVAPVLMTRFWAGDRYLECGGMRPGNRPELRFLEVPAWSEIRLERHNLTNLAWLELSPDQRTLAIGYNDGTAVWNDFVTGTRRDFFPTRHGGTMRVQFSADGRWFVTGGVMNGLMTLCDVASRRQTSIGPDQPYVLHNLAFSPDGQRLVTSGASLGDLFRFWDVATGRDLLSLTAEAEGFYARLGFSPDGNTLFAASVEGTVLLWRAPSREEIEAADRGLKKP